MKQQRDDVKAPLETRRILMLGLLLLVLWGIATAAWSQAQQDQNGIRIYWGVVPGELIASRKALERLHGSGPSHGGELHHLVIAVFDAVSGARINDARVRIEMTQPRMAGEPTVRALAPMSTEGVITYGQLFRAPPPGPYRFKVWVQLAGRTDAVEFDITGTSPHRGGR